MGAREDFREGRRRDRGQEAKEVEATAGPECLLWGRVSVVSWERGCPAYTDAPCATSAPLLFGIWLRSEDGRWAGMWSGRQHLSYGWPNLQTVRQPTSIVGATQFTGLCIQESDSALNKEERSCDSLMTRKMLSGLACHCLIHSVVCSDRK